jgi:hypothetical protein
MGLLAPRGASARSEPTRSRQRRGRQPCHAPVGLGSGMKHHNVAQEATMRVLRPTVYALLLTLAPGPALLAIAYLLVRAYWR